LVGSIKAWLLVVAVLALCSFGIYLGRVQRMNSWDIFVRPLALAHAASGAAIHLRPLALTILFTCFLVATYLVLYSFATRPPWFSPQLQPPADDEQNGNTPKRPRLMFVITLAEHGGAQTYLSLLLPAVANRFDVTVAAHGPGPLEDATRAAGVRFLPLKHVRRPIALVHDVLGLVELIRLFRRERPDIVHANSSKAGVLGRLAAFVAGVPIRVFTFNGWAFAAYDGFAGRLYLWADRAVRPLTTLVICVSHRERELGLRARACASERSAVVHNAVDLRPFRVAVTRGEPPQIVSVGRFAYPKDYVTLVQGMASVASDFRATLVGEGPDRPAVANEVRRLGLEASVALVGARNDVPQLLAGADVFVLSSRSEGLPMSVLEAMAAGLPVVATDVGGVSELVLEGETGLLVPRGDTTALAQALERLLRDADLRRRMGATARARVEREFDLTSFQEAHVELYCRELERRGLPLPGLDQEAADGEPRRLRAVGQGSSGTRRIGPSASQ
jgi:glycosyltransferase involved in cell wall biosynthesis